MLTVRVACHNLYVNMCIGVRLFFSLVPRKNMIPTVKKNRMGEKIRKKRDLKSRRVRVDQ